MLLSNLILEFSLVRIGVRATLDLGGSDLIARKKLHTRKHALYKHTQVAVKTKTFTILTSNERIMIPILNPDFLNLQGKRKLVRKIGYFEKSRVTIKITMFD